MEILKNGDTVTFTVGDSVLNYAVREDYLTSLDGYSNYVVFAKLGLSDAQRTDLAAHYYGYEPRRGGDWPYFRKNDFQAVTELVKGIHDLCNKHNIKLREDERA